MGCGCSVVEKRKACVHGNVRGLVIPLTSSWEDTIIRHLVIEKHPMCMQCGRVCKTHDVALDHIIYPEWVEREDRIAYALLHMAYTNKSLYVMYNGMRCIINRPTQNKYAPIMFDKKLLLTSSYGGEHRSIPGIDPEVAKNVANATNDLKSAFPTVDERIMHLHACIYGRRKVDPIYEQYEVSPFVWSCHNGVMHKCPHCNGSFSALGLAMHIVAYYGVPATSDGRPRVSSNAFALPAFQIDEMSSPTLSESPSQTIDLNGVSDTFTNSSSFCASTLSSGISGQINTYVLKLVTQLLTIHPVCDRAATITRYNKLKRDSSISTMHMGRPVAELDDYSDSGSMSDGAHGVASLSTMSKDARNIANTKDRSGYLYVIGKCLESSMFFKPKFIFESPDHPYQDYHCMTVIPRNLSPRELNPAANRIPGSVTMNAIFIPSTTDTDHLATLIFGGTTATCPCCGMISDVTTVICHMTDFFMTFAGTILPPRADAIIETMKMYDRAWFFGVYFITFNMSVKWSSSMLYKRIVPSPTLTKATYVEYISPGPSPKFQQHEDLRGDTGSEGYGYGHGHDYDYSRNQSRRGSLLSATSEKDGIKCAKSSCTSICSSLLNYSTEFDPPAAN